MTDSLQAVERARWLRKQVDFTGDGTVHGAPRWIAQVLSEDADALEALAAALADTEDAMRMHDRQAGTFLKRAEAAEARVAELEAAQERVRLRMLKAHSRTTEGRDTFADGFFNGLAAALDEFVLPALAAADRKET